MRCCHVHCLSAYEGWYQSAHGAAMNISSEPRDTHESVHQSNHANRAAVRVVPPRRRGWAFPIRGFDVPTCVSFAGPSLAANRITESSRGSRPSRSFLARPMTKTRVFRLAASGKNFLFTVDRRCAEQAVQNRAGGIGDWRSVRERTRAAETAPPRTAAAIAELAFVRRCACCGARARYTSPARRCAKFQ